MERLFKDKLLNILDLLIILSLCVIIVLPLGSLASKIVMSVGSASLLGALVRIGIIVRRNRKDRAAGILLPEYKPERNKWFYIDGIGLIVYFGLLLIFGNSKNLPLIIVTVAIILAVIVSIGVMWYRRRQQKQTEQQQRQ